MPDITLVLMTCGEQSEGECLQAIEPFRSEVEFKEVRNVYPQIAALNQMIDSVETEYFIPLDADIVLEPDAWPRIKNALNKHRHRDEWHTILFSLWDTLTERRILALKIMRTSCMKENRFVDSATPDVEHFSRLANQQYTCIQDYIKQKHIGRHIVAGRHFCYFKYRDVYQTYRAHNFEWDNGVFMGGTDLRSRAKAHFDFFFFKYVKTRDEDCLHCIAGMMDGILSPLENKSKTLENQVYRFDAANAVDEFMNWYLEPYNQSPSSHYIP